MEAEKKDPCASGHPDAMSFYDPRCTCEGGDLRVEAESFRRAASAESAWISVEERVPAQDECALATDGERQRVAYAFAVGVGGLEWMMAGAGGKAFVRVTHWMPLPALPLAAREGREAGT